MSAARPLIGYTLFDTPVGRCGLAWRDDALAAAQLPEHDDARTLARLLGREGGASGHWRQVWARRRQWQEGFPALPHP